MYRYTNKYDIQTKQHYARLNINIVFFIRYGNSNPEWPTDTHGDHFLPRYIGWPRFGEAGWSYPSCFQTPDNNNITKHTHNSVVS